MRSQTFGIYLTALQNPNLSVFKANIVENIRNKFQVKPLRFGFQTDSDRRLNAFNDFRNPLSLNLL